MHVPKDIQNPEHFLWEKRERKGKSHFWNNTSQEILKDSLKNQKKKKDKGRNNIKKRNISTVFLWLPSTVIEN